MLIFVTWFFETFPHPMERLMPYSVVFNSTAVSSRKQVRIGGKRSKFKQLVFSSHVRCRDELGRWISEKHHVTLLGDLKVTRALFFILFYPLLSWSISPWWLPFMLPANLFIMICHETLCKCSCCIHSIQRFNLFNITSYCGYNNVHTSVKSSRLMR